MCVQQESADRKDIFPSKLQWLIGSPISLNRPYEEVLKKINQPNFAASAPISIIHRALPDSLPLEITEVVPRAKEGGAFVKYTHKPGNAQSDVDIEQAIQEHLEKNPITPWFNPFQGVGVSRVLEGHGLRTSIGSRARGLGLNSCRLRQTRLRRT